MPSKLPLIAVAVILWKHDQLLLGKRINSQAENCWQFPGGHLEYGEDIAECAARELLEETGLSARHMRQAAFSNTLFSPAQSHYVTLYVSAAYDGGEAKVLEPDKCECWDWFDYDHLPSPLFQPIENLLQLYPDLKQLCAGLAVPANVQK